MRQAPLWVKRGAQWVLHPGMSASSQSGRTVTTGRSAANGQKRTFNFRAIIGNREPFLGVCSPMTLIPSMALAAATLLVGPTHAQDRLIAIDVLLQPDAKMLEEAAIWNSRMREQSPEGFRLDEEHTPHITLIQRFIAEDDLVSVLAAIDQVKARF